MRSPHLRSLTTTRGATSAAVVAGLATASMALGGCGGDGPAPDAVKSSAHSAIATPTDPRSQLTARAAAAKDRHYIAGYTYSRPGRRNATLVMTVATDGLWRAEIPGGALGGTVDITLVHRADGTYQCRMDETGGCAKVAGPEDDIPAAVDPRSQHPFTDWLDILTDLTVAITVTTASPLPGTAGSCFAVEPTTVTLTPAIKASTFCYTDDGTLTGVQADFGALTLSGVPAPGPATVDLPGRITSRAPLQVAAPPAPPPKTTAPATPAAGRS